MVQFIITPKIKQALDLYYEIHPLPINKDTHESNESNESNNTNESQQQQLSTTPSSSSISHKDLIFLSKYFSSSSSSLSSSQFPLSSLLKNTHIYFPPKPQPKPKTKEYIQLMERLRLQQAEAEYLSMTQSTTTTSINNNNLDLNAIAKRTAILKGLDYDEYDESLVTLSPSQQLKLLKDYIATIVNVFVTLASVAWAIWYWTDYYPNMSLGVRTLLCFFACIITLIAEVTVYLSYKSKVKDARISERKLIEKKEIINSTVFSSSSSITTSTTTNDSSSLINSIKNNSNSYSTNISKQSHQPRNRKQNKSSK